MRNTQERQIIATILAMGKEALNRVLEEGLGIECFKDKSYALIFSTIVEADKRGDDFDLISIHEALVNTQCTLSLQELAILSSESCETLFALAMICKRLKSSSAKDSFIRLLNNSRQYLEEADSHNIAEQIEKAQSEIMSFEASLSSTEIEESCDIVKKAMVNMFSDKSQPALATGLHSLDNIIEGFTKQEMVVLAGRPSTGKTALSLTLIANMLKLDPKLPILFFTYEMSSVKLMSRMICIDSEVCSHNIARKRITEEEVSAIRNTRSFLSNSNFCIVDNNSLTIEGLHRVAKRFRNKHGNLGLICIDYLQLIKATDKRISREQQVAHISSQIKDIAKALDTPVLILSQFSRDCEKEERDPRPSDLRESGSIEQDADKIILLSPLTNGENGNEVKTIVAKNRDGKIGVGRLYFDKTITKYVNKEYE